MEDLSKLDEEMLKTEERELRKLLPASATLHNCILLSLSKDGIKREFFKFGGLLVCQDSKSEMGMDKFLAFSWPAQHQEDNLKGKIQRWLKTRSLQKRVLVAADPAVSRLFQELLLEIGKCWEFEERTHQYTQQQEEDNHSEDKVDKKIIEEALVVRKLCLDQVYTTHLVSSQQN